MTRAAQNRAVDGILVLLDWAPRDPGAVQLRDGAHPGPHSDTRPGWPPPALLALPARKIALF